jgi:hypothetical protein
MPEINLVGNDYQREMASRVPLSELARIARLPEGRFVRRRDRFTTSQLKCLAVAAEALRGIDARPVTRQDYDDALEYVARSLTGAVGRVGESLPARKSLTRGSDA